MLQKIKGQCQTHNAYHMANKWKKLQRHEGRCGRNFGRKGSRAHKDPEEMVKQGTEVSDDEDGDENPSTTK